MPVQRIAIALIVCAPAGWHLAIQMALGRGL